MPILTIYFPGQPPADHSLHEEVVTIGRMKGNAIQLAHGSVSQSHARIMRVESNYFLKDLKSTNGTLVNGQAIKETQLADGDQVKLGEVTATFRLEGGLAPVPKSEAVTGSPATIPTPAVAVPASAPPTASAIASELEKSDTTILSAKAKTSLMRRPIPLVEVNPPVPPPKKKNSTWLLLAIFAGVAAAAIVGFLAWKFAGSEKAESVAKAPALSRSSSIAKANPTTNAPAPPMETVVTSAPSPVVALTNAVEQAETERIAQLLAVLRQPDLKERRRAAREISQLGAGASNVVLNLRLALVQDADPDVRVWLVAALVSNQAYDPAHLSILMDGLKVDDARARQRACESLALIPYPDIAAKEATVAALKVATADENEDVQKAALATLKIIAPE